MALVITHLGMEYQYNIRWAFVGDCHYEHTRKGVGLDWIPYLKMHVTDTTSYGRNHKLCVGKV